MDEWIYRWTKWMDKQTGIQTWQTDRQTDRQTDKQTAHIESEVVSVGAVHGVSEVLRGALGQLALLVQQVNHPLLPHLYQVCGGRYGFTLWLHSMASQL